MSSQSEQSEDHLTIDLTGPGWRATLNVAPPQGQRPRRADFSVEWAGHQLTRMITAEVRYTSAENLRDGWPAWHVKIYRCTSSADAMALRAFLRRQSLDIRAANAALDGPARIPINPPWAVVPVEIARGDGALENYGGTATELGASIDDLDDNRQRLQRWPAWFAHDHDTAERTVMAISPSIEEIMWPSVAQVPATQHLSGFMAMAVGLDSLHANGVVHSDIKPANVCGYHTNDGYRYVLIDADAATRVSPEPVTLRWTNPYVHVGVLDWAKQERQRGMALNARTLLAHDRFCFALVVLSAIAGVDWVRANLLTPDNPYESSERPVDRYDEVVTRLARAWQADARTVDRRKLIEALAEPFRPGVLEGDWSASAWIRRIREAQLPAPNVEDQRIRGWYSRELDSIRAEIKASFPLHSQVVARAVDVVDAHGRDIAWRAARGWLFGVAGCIIAAALLVCAGAIGLGR